MAVKFHSTLKVLLGSNILYMSPGCTYHQLYCHQSVHCVVVTYIVILSVELRCVCCSTALAVASALTAAICIREIIVARKRKIKISPCGFVS